MKKWFMARCSHVQPVIDEFDGYYPCIQRWTKPGRKRKPVISEVPILPNIVILSTSVYHISKLSAFIRSPVYFGNDLLLLTDRDIERLREIEKEHKIQLVDDPAAPEYKPGLGEEVRILSPCFEKKIGKITAINPDGSYQVSIKGWDWPISFDGCLLVGVGVYGRHSE